jgi:superfamily II DNA or RNA helicase
VGKVANDDISLLTQDLGVEVKSKPEDISNWLKRKTTAITVVFVTYHSGEILSEASADAKYSFDLGIFDEAHKTVGVKERLFGHLLFDRNINIEKRLFMTATERRYQGVSENILSMDDPETYGDTFELLSFKEALECDPPILCDYQIVTIAVTTKEIESLIRSNVFVKPSSGKLVNELEAKMLAAVIQLRKTMKGYPLSHCISFHQSIARAKAFQETNENVSKTFPEYGELNTYHVTGAMPTSRRQEVLDEAISSDRSLITNSRCLTEGVDVKQIDGVLFADPKGSAVDIVQAVGRALRPHKGKKMGYVLVPIIIDSDKIEDRVEQSEAYADLLTVLRALASNDERIIEYFRSIGEGKKPTKNKKDFIFTIPESLEIDSGGFARQVELMIWDKLAKLSWRPFEEAREFVRRLGLRSGGEWLSYCKGEFLQLPIKPPDIPASPEYIYQNLGWINLGDWLGTGIVATRQRTYRSFKSARKFIHKLSIRTQIDYKKWCKEGLGDLIAKPQDIPANPNRTYKSEWISWPDWLGSTHISSIEKRRKRIPFNEARKFAKTLKLKGQKDWNAYCKGELPHLEPKPEGIPACPWESYKNDGWINLGDWLGTGIVATGQRSYKSFELARKFAKTLKLKGQKEWNAYCKGELSHLEPKPHDIPADPSAVYRNKGWVSLGDWLGTGFVHCKNREYRNFEDAKKFAVRLGLKSQNEWNQFYENKIKLKASPPSDIPKAPHVFYKKKGWVSWGDFLGSGYIAGYKRKYMSFNEAKDFARSLNIQPPNIWDQWRLYVKSGLPGRPDKPVQLPTVPHKTYKDKGWVSMQDFLGAVENS